VKSGQAEMLDHFDIFMLSIAYGEKWRRNIMNLYISDLHFGHSNVINFDHRPFADVNEMDYALIELWNSRVQKDDDVYIVGDFCFRSEKTPDWYLKKLSGHKHLVIGNHDGKMLEDSKAMSYFESVDKMMHVSDGDKQICLCHFPLAEWNRASHGSWHIYGHIHNRKEDTYQFMKTKERALNAAACINNYTPASMNELIRNNKIFQEEKN
jgi:calcineurin-like phosphoesterase family protein